MGYQNAQKSSPRPVWRLARRQQGVIARRQLIEAGMHPQAIKHRVASGRLHPIRRGIYAVGRPGLTQRGRWMAAVLACGPESILSHGSAAMLWGIRPGGRATHPSPAAFSAESGNEPIDISVPTRRTPRRTGIRVHRVARWTEADIVRRDGIPVTSPVRTLIDLGTQLRARELEAAVNDADKLDLVDPETLRRELDGRRGMRGIAVLRKILDRRTFALTDSELERRFLPLARRAGLPRPETGCRLNGFKVDFHWPELGLIVETDGLRYHRTPAQQTHDRLRDQVHAAAGLTTLRFTHAQVRFEPERVIRTLAAVASRLAPTRRKRRR
jgi:very-short-patch-repair endonuclease